MVSNHSNNNALGRIQTFNLRILFAQKSVLGLEVTPTPPWQQKFAIKSHLFRIWPPTASNTDKDTLRLQNDKCIS